MESDLLMRFEVLTAIIVMMLPCPYWSASYFHIPSLIGSFPSAFDPQIIYKPSTSQLYHLSPEDGNRMFLRNVGTDPPRRLNQRQYQHQQSFSLLFWQCQI